MSTKKSTEPARVFEAATDYETRVARVVTHKKTVLRPSGTYVIKGRVLSELPADAIKSATPV